jgi:hypothetical protein
MRFLGGLTAALVLTVAALLFPREGFAADAGTVRLFAATDASTWVLAPKPEDDGLTLFKGVSMLDKSEPGGGLRLQLSLRLPEPTLLTRPLEATSSATAIQPIRAASAWMPLRPWATAATVATTIYVSARNSVVSPSKGYHFQSEGFFGRNTYTGGVDKAAHFVDYTITQRVFEQLYGRIGYSDGQSRWIGFATAMIGGLTTEIGDGTANFGFSWDLFPRTPSARRRRWAFGRPGGTTPSGFGWATFRRVRLRPAARTTRTSAGTTPGRSTPRTSRLPAWRAG